ncbi:MAG: GlcG/HbpS family heme-binding protein [Rhodomicrobium sp.]
MDALTLAQANELTLLAMEKAKAEYSRPICVAVCDPAGFLIAFQRMEGAPLRSIAIAQGKAYSAARMQVSTDALLQRLERENIPVSYFCDDRITALPGGSVLKNADGAITGAAGISGLTSAEDQEIADFLANMAAQSVI